MKRPTLLERHKVVLTRQATARGVGKGMKQAMRCLADTLVRERHLVFRLESEHLSKQDPSHGNDLYFREIEGFDEIPIQAQERLSRGDVDWGGAAWFSLGWRLWVGTLGDDLVGLGWWRSAAQAQDFFIDLPDDSELLWHSTVVPEFRGRGLQVPLRLSLMQNRAQSGVTAFYTNCRDYNTPSHRNILRMGFRMIGYFRVSKITGRGRWIGIEA